MSANKLETSHLVLSLGEESLSERGHGSGISGLLSLLVKGLSDSHLSQEEQTDAGEDEGKGGKDLGPHKRLGGVVSSDLQGNDFGEEGRDGEDSENHTSQGRKQLETSNLSSNGSDSDPNGTHNQTVEDGVEDVDSVGSSGQPDAQVEDDNEQSSNQGHVDSAKLVRQVSDSRSSNGHGARHDGGNVGGLVSSKADSQTGSRHGVEHDNVARQREEAPGENQSTLVVEEELPVEARELHLESGVGLSDENGGTNVDDKSHDTGGSEGPLQTPDVDPSLGGQNEEHTANTRSSHRQTVGQRSLLQEPHGHNVDSGNEQNTQGQALEKTLGQVQVPDLGSERGRHLRAGLHASADKQKNSQIHVLGTLDVERSKEETGSQSQTTYKGVVRSSGAGKGLVSQVMGQENGKRRVDTPRGGVDGHGTANRDPSVASIGRRSEARRERRRSSSRLLFSVFRELLGHDGHDSVQLVADGGKDDIVIYNVSTENHLVFVSYRLDRNSCNGRRGAHGVCLQILGCRERRDFYIYKHSDGL